MTNSEVVAELERIAAEHRGLLRAEDVLAAAKEETSPLHPKFTWDDSIAAEQYRLQQARQLIRVCVQYIGAGDRQIKTRVYVSLTPDRVEGGGYRPMATVMSTEEYRRQLLYDAMQEMRHFAEKYQGLRELAEVFEVIRKAAQQDIAA